MRLISLSYVLHTCIHMQTVKRILLYIKDTINYDIQILSQRLYFVKVFPMLIGHVILTRGGQLQVIACLSEPVTCAGM